MGTTDVLVAIAAVLAVGCSHRAHPQYQYSGATDPIPGTDRAGARPGGRRPPVVVEAPARAARPDGDTTPRTVSGIALEPSLSSACRLRPSPKAFFEFDSADLDGRDVELLRSLAACLTGPLRGHSIELVGRTDPLGSSEYNQRLARARAQAVRDFLVGQGVPAAHIVLRVAAEALTDPLWPPGWDHDRRVDIRLIPP